MSTHELVFRHRRIASSNCIPTGLTVVEVLFAMVIILVGLIGVAAMIPFAGRQAEDSYKITQAGAAGEISRHAVGQRIHPAALGHASRGLAAR